VRVAVEHARDRHVRDPGGGRDLADVRPFGGGSCAHCASVWLLGRCSRPGPVHRSSCRIGEPPRPSRPAIRPPGASARRRGAGETPPGIAIGPRAPPCPPTLDGAVGADGPVHPPLRTAWLPPRPPAPPPC